MIKQEIAKKIMRNSISLKKYGLNDLAWEKEDAQNLINEIMGDKIGILGGDVYKLTSTHLTSLSENWSCESMEEESEEEYFFRSKSESLKYIENYPVHLGENIVFSIIFTEKIDEITR